ncbi:MAG TPA: hypothetical protein VGC67_10360 [Cellulomonas sp.]
MGAFTTVCQAVVRELSQVDETLAAAIASGTCPVDALPSTGGDLARLVHTREDLLRSARTVLTELPDLVLSSRPQIAPLLCLRR